MKYRDINDGEFFDWSGLLLMKLDDNGSVIVNHSTQSGTILDFDNDEEVIPLNCEMKFTKREE